MALMIISCSWRQHCNKGRHYWINSIKLGIYIWFTSPSMVIPKTCIALLDLYSCVLIITIVLAINFKAHHQSFLEFNLMHSQREGTRALNSILTPSFFLFPITGFMVDNKPHFQARPEELNLPSQGGGTSSNPKISIRGQRRTMRSSLTWPMLLVELGINDKIKGTILISQTKLVIWTAIISRWPACSSHGHKGQYNAKWTGR